MIYISYYSSPLGELLLASEDDKLIGLWMEGQKYYFSNITGEIRRNDDDIVLIKTKKWLDRYFNGENPDVDELELNPKGSEFRKMVWEVLCDIPYGSVITYRDIAMIIEKRMGIGKMSAQAVGGAVGHNPISIIIPCHRVVGKDGSLTGYAGGIDRKVYLLNHEGVNLEEVIKISMSLT